MLSRALRPLIAASLAREIATSRFTASRTERNPDCILPHGIPPSTNLWRSSNRVVLVLQRLEPEKETVTALAAWEQARLWEQGWTMRIVGDGSQRGELESWAASKGLPEVTFAGWVARVDREFESAGMLLAPTPNEALGLGVLEAMAAGVPIVASASGGHLETVGRLRDGRLFPAVIRPAQRNR